MARSGFKCNFVIRIVLEARHDMSTFIHAGTNMTMFVLDYDYDLYVFIFDHVGASQASRLKRNSGTPTLPGDVCF